LADMAISTTCAFQLEVERGMRLTVPLRSPNVGPASDIKVSAPQAAAFFSPESSSNSPWMMVIRSWEVTSEGSFEGVRT
jgi:hypothetical protein